MFQRKEHPGYKRKVLTSFRRYCIRTFETKRLQLQAMKHLFALGLLVFAFACHQGHGVYLLRPSFYRLIGHPSMKSNIRATPAPLKFQFYDLEMNEHFWERYQLIAKNCEKITSFWIRKKTMNIFCVWQQ